MSFLLDVPDTIWLITYYHICQYLLTAVIELTEGGGAAACTFRRP